MARRAHQHATNDRALPAAVLLLLIVSFVPPRLLLPVSWISDLTVMLAAPVSQPLRLASAWLAPPDPGEADPEEVALLKQRVEEYRTLWQKELTRNQDLLNQMEQLGLLQSLNPGVRTKLLNAPVIGSSGTQLQIRAGTGLGVHQNDVVAVGGVQLFGSVRDASARTSWIMPITAKAQGRLEAAVMIEDGRSAACLLAPVGDGTLRGDVLYNEGDPGASQAVAVGQTVRLSDDAWPDSAQMLVVGTVESVEPAPDSPLRPVVVVRPLVTLERVTEVIVRVSSMPEDGGGP